MYKKNNVIDGTTLVTVKRYFHGILNIIALKKYIAQK